MRVWRQCRQTMTVHALAAPNVAPGGAVARVDVRTSLLHFFGRQRSALTMAMRVSLSSAAAPSSFFDFGGIAAAREWRTRAAHAGEDQRHAKLQLTHAREGQGGEGGGEKGRAHFLHAAAASLQLTRDQLNASKRRQISFTEHLGAAV